MLKRGGGGGGGGCAEIWSVLGMYSICFMFCNLLCIHID